MWNEKNQCVLYLQELSIAYGPQCIFNKEVHIDQICFHITNLVSINQILFLE